MSQPQVNQRKVGDTEYSKNNNYFAKYDGTSWLVCKTGGTFLFRVFLMEDVRASLAYLEKLKGGIA